MTERRFDGRVAVITGAGRGLGREYALFLGSKGAKVVVNDLGASMKGEGTDAGPANEVVREIRAIGGEAVACTESVATPSIDDVANQIDAIRDTDRLWMLPTLPSGYFEHLQRSFAMAKQGKGQRHLIARKLKH